MRGNRTIRYFTAHIKKLAPLNLKEKDVLMRRLKEVTLREVGETHNVTEGRIRQIEKAALKKIKSKIYQQKLFRP